MAIKSMEKENRNIPALVYIEPADKYKLPLLHISTRMEKDRIRHDITECNRMIKHPFIYSEKTIDTDGYRLCARCAKEQADFEKILVEFHHLRAELAQKRKEQQAQKELEQQKEREALQARLVAFADKFLDGLPVELDGHKLHAKYDGRLYEIREVTK